MGAFSMFSGSQSLKSMLEGRLASNTSVPMVGSLSDIQNISISLSMLFISNNNFNSICQPLSYIYSTITPSAFIIAFSYQKGKQQSLSKQIQYNFQQQFVMKKIATNKNQLNQTSYFESKRVSNTKANTLLPEKRSPLQSIQNHLHKVQSYKLKTEQAHYKNENDSSLDKQIDFNVRKSTELKSGNIAKAKCQNMYKKDVKKIAINLQSIIEKNTTTEGRKQQDFFTILSIQKNESKFKTTSLVSSPKTNKLSQELEEKQVGRNLTKKRPSLKEYMANTRLYQQLNKLTETNYILCKKIDELTEELNYKNQLLSQKQEQLHAQRDMCQLIQNKCDQIEHVFIDQRNASIQHIEQLTLQNNSLIVVNMKLAAQRQLLLKQMVHCDGDLKRKTEFLQIDIRQYQKRQNIYIQQVQRLKKMIESWSYPNSPQQPHFTKLEQSLEQKQINLQQIGQKGNTQSYSLIQTKFFDSNRIS